MFKYYILDNIVALWLGGDHYKWRIMRASGIS
ncbi:glucuronate isomerase, partial [Streptococcus agalactiae]